MWSIYTCTEGAFVSPPFWNQYICLLQQKWYGFSLFPSKDAPETG